MRRREFIALLGGGLFALPAHEAASRAGDRLRRIGFLSSVSLPDDAVNAFERGLEALGLHTGRDIAIEYRYAEGNFDRLPALAAELVALKLELIVAFAAPETEALRAAANGIVPIVFAAHGDPIGTGAVQSLAHPGGMITGLSIMHRDLSRKQLELLKECTPTISRIAIVWNSGNPAKANDWNEATSAAQTLGLLVDSHEVRTPTEIDGVLTALRAHRPDGLLTIVDPLTFSLRTQIVNFALEQRLPSVASLQGFTEAGGLMSYSADGLALLRRVAGYVEKILNGVNPSDLPVEQPVKFELAVNLKTAKLIGLRIPTTLLARADEVIE